MIKQMVGIAAKAYQKSEQLASKDRSDFEGMVILPEIRKEEERVHEEDKRT